MSVKYKRSLSGRSAESSTSLSSFITTEPEKEPLTIDLNEVEPEFSSVLSDVVDLVNSKLWHWKRFPINLPEPIIHKNQDGTLSARRKTLRLDQLFRTPNFNELKQISEDSSGQPKKLTARQLDSIKKNGEFEIDSVQFPGQKHRWIVTQLLIKGKLKAHETMNKDIARALYLLYSTARSRLDGPYFSLCHSLNGWSQGLMATLDIFFGAPLMKTVNLKDKIQEERAKFLVAELSCASSDTLKALTDHLEKLLSHVVDPDKQPPPLPYLFKTPASFDVDLRLFSNDLMSTAKPHLLHLLSSCLQGWFIERKLEVLNELRKENEDNAMTEDDISEKATKILKSEYVERVCDGVRADQGIKDIGHGVTDLLVEQLRTSLIIDEILSETRERIRDHRDKIEKGLKSSQPILSHIRPWLQRKLDAANEAFMTRHRWEPHERAIAGCKAQKLEQSAYFIQRDMTFMKDREPVLKKELKNLKYPEKNFNFRKHIWLPKNYIVKEKTNSGGQDYETIPTVISRKAEYQFLAADGGRHRFLLIKEAVSTNSTRYPFWRWTNFFKRTWAWMWNALFLLGVVVPWCSPLSFRALVLAKPFYVEYELNQSTGALQRSQSSKTHTVWSRFTALWAHVREARKQFETLPDTGLLSKNFTRHIHRFVNYVLKGFFGSFIILVLYPVAVLSVSLTSMLLALTCPFWLPVASALGHIFCALICDFEGTSYLGAFAWNFLFNIVCLGIIQPVLVVIVACIICPALSMLLAGCAVVRKGLRDAWDALVFQLLIKKRARVPDHDNILAKRIAGPGMASEYFYQIKPEQALVALETRLELSELEAYEAETRSRIVEPTDSGYNLLKRMFRPLGVMPSRKTPGPVQQLEQETDELLNVLRERLDARRLHLNSNLPPSVLSRIRLTDTDLRTVLMQGVLMVRDFYPPRVFARMRKKEDRGQWWERMGLAGDDWLGLTSSLLVDFFGAEFLTPLQEEDVYFQLKVEHWNLDRYVNMTMDTNWKDDLDMSHVTSLHHVNTKVRQPMISIEAFNPMHGANRHSFSAHLSFRHNILSTRWYVHHPHRFPATVALTSPVPVAHPADVVLVIYQRDNASINFNVEAIRAKLGTMCGLNMPLETAHHSESDSSSSSDSYQSDDATPKNSLYDVADFEDAADRLKRKRRQKKKAESASASVASTGAVVRRVVVTSARGSRAGSVSDAGSSPGGTGTVV